MGVAFCRFPVIEKDAGRFGFMGDRGLVVCVEKGEFVSALLCFISRTGKEAWFINIIKKKRKLLGKQYIKILSRSKGLE